MYILSILSVTQGTNFYTFLSLWGCFLWDSLELNTFQGFGPSFHAGVTCTRKIRGVERCSQGLLPHGANLLCLFVPADWTWVLRKESRGNVSLGRHLDDHILSHETPRQKPYFLTLQQWIYMSVYYRIIDSSEVPLWYGPPRLVLTLKKKKHVHTQ